MQLSRDDVRAVRARVEKALLAEFGNEVSFNFGNIRYSGNSLRFTGLDITVKGEGETDADAAKASWDAACYREGMKPEDFGKVIEYNFKKVKLNSIHTRRKKYSIGAIDLETGTEILLVRDAVARILGYVSGPRFV